MLRCPCEYCSMTSRTSYGLRACWNFLRATKYLIFLIALIAFLWASVKLQTRKVILSLSIVDKRYKNSILYHKVFLNITSIPRYSIVLLFVILFIILFIIRWARFGHTTERGEQFFGANKSGFISFIWFPFRGRNVSKRWLSSLVLDITRSAYKRLTVNASYLGIG